MGPVSLTGLPWRAPLRPGAGGGRFRGNQHNATSWRMIRQTNKAVPLSNPNTRLAPRPSIINTDDSSLFMAARHTGSVAKYNLLLTMNPQ